MAENLDRTLEHLDLFVRRHIGPRQAEIQEMVEFLGVDSLERLTSNLIPKDIRITKPLQLGSCKTETEGLAELKQLAEKNKVYRSLIGMGYYGTITPAVILRNILENPGWYTQYTPYQAEIAQGRLEALFNFQTMIVDLTGLPIANASLLDEATAAAEAMAMCFALKERNANQVFFVSETCHPQTIEVIRTRAEPMGIRVVVGNHEKYDFQVPTFGALIQNPSTDGIVHDFTAFISHAHEAGALVVMAADLLSLTLFKSPGEFGADIAVGSAQRFGVSLGYGGPHAAYLSTKDEFKRLIPGRIVGASKDVDGKTAYRLALQTREQHIRRDKATSNICTSQVLLAVMASMYAVYHGPNGLKGIAEKIQRSAMYLRQALEALGYETGGHAIFDTLRVSVGEEKARFILNEAKSRNYNFRVVDSGTLGISLDEQTDDRELNELIEIFSSQSQRKSSLDLERLKQKQIRAPSGLLRTNTYLTQSVFNSYHSETEMLRYIFRLQSKDLSLAQSMIPLGSCTMKLNATSEMIPVTWPSLSNIHPFAPLDQTLGYQELFRQLEKMLEEITGFAAASLQPNAGSQGEYAGLLVIRKYHQMKGQSHRNICLIPKSAHGTNPASAALAGMQVVVVECDEQGNVDLSDLKNKAGAHRSDLAALMVTYPSTHGVFEEKIREICSIVHENGGQVYMDGANMNAQIGLCRPGEYGPDVCHLNLHKTFCIPHGGGGPGMGPILVAKHLAPYLPGHSVVKVGNEQAIGAVSAAPWGSSNILPISWMYISMMGASGLKLATEIAILSANYVAKKLEAHYPVLYKGQNGWVAHECIFDLRQFKRTANIEIEDVAKRLMDYGFHAPTISFPVAGTMMVEPTESESKAELDRFCEAMILIREEIREIEEGRMSREDNVLKNAPHTAQQIAKSEWKHPYSREKAVYPAAWLVENKFWPGVGRINNVLGDRNLVCSCS